MSLNNNFRFLLLLYVSFSLNVFGQQIKKTQDLGLWSGISMEYKVNKELKFQFVQDIRFFESLTALDKYISQIGTTYKITKSVKLGGDLRYFLNKEDDQTISQNWRYNLDFKANFKLIKKVKLNYRLRFQTNHEELFGFVYKGSRSNLRNKIALSYKISKMHLPYLSAEFFRAIVNYRKPYFNKIRWLLGDKVLLNKNELNVSLGYERELNSDYPFHYFFGRLYYTFQLKK